MVPYHTQPAVRPIADCQGGRTELHTHMWQVGTRPIWKAVTTCSRGLGIRHPVVCSDAHPFMWLARLPWQG